MKIVITGASGFIGSALTPYLESKGHIVKRLVRTHKNEPHFGFWDPENQILDPKELEGYDAVINLSGENVAKGRWNKQRKQRIYNSRIQSTHLLSKTLLEMKNPPRIYINASSVGYYGNKVEPTNENGTYGHDFLAKVSKDWEEATTLVKSKRIRIILMRLGMVLSPQGGALAAMYPYFKLGLGGKISSGKQIISWISLEDLLAAFYFCLTHPSIEGPVNAVAPFPITNKQFTESLGKALHRPVIFPIPALILKLFFGEMAEALLLNSSNITPEKLINSGFEFTYSSLEKYLAKMF